MAQQTGSETIKIYMDHGGVYVPSTMRKLLCAWYWTLTLHYQGGALLPLSPLKRL